MAKRITELLVSRCPNCGNDMTLETWMDGNRRAKLACGNCGQATIIQRLANKGFPKRLVIGAGADPDLESRDAR